MKTTIKEDLKTMGSNSAYNFKVLTKDRRIKDVGTTQGSWKTLSQAKELCNRELGDIIYEYCPKTGDPLWEVF